MCEGKVLVTGKDVASYCPDLCTECAKQLDLNPAPLVYVINIRGTNHIVYVSYFSWDKIEYPDKFELLAKQRKLSYLAIKPDDTTLCGLKIPMAYSAKVLATGPKWLKRPFAERLLSLCPKVAGEKLVRETFEQHRVPFYFGDI